MIGKQLFFILLFVFAGHLVRAQQGVETFGTGGNSTFDEEQDGEHTDDEDSKKQEKKYVPSIITNWEVENYGANFEEAQLDTTLGFYHVYNPIFKRDLRPVFTGNIGGAYQFGDFFNRDYQSDFYFYRSYEAYAKFPGDIKFMNTTTPYTILDYTQSDNKNTRNETRFNVFHSQNATPKFNFQLFYDQDKSTGFYQYQENKFHDIGLATTYRSDKFNSHGAIIFNRIKNEENGGLEPDQDLNEYQETETYLVNLTTANSQISNNTIWLNNEYKLGKYEEQEDSLGNLNDVFRPISGFIHQLEYSSNRRIYEDTAPDLDYYPSARDSSVTGDSVYYNRLTNVLQLKFYESPNRKYTFSKRVFIGHDLISSRMADVDSTYLVKDKMHNTFVGGAISRDEGEFWRWNIQGKFYTTGYRSGQTELSAFIYKPLRIGKDTTSLFVSGELNTIVPDYYQQQYHSNHYNWINRFDNTNEMIIKSKIHSQRRHLTLGFNYALIGNYIFNNEDALPEQGGSEMLVLSAYLNKDIETKFWLIRAQALWQKSNQEDYLHLPDLTGYLSVSFKLLISKVMYSDFGFDVRYTTAYYADAFNSATGSYYWQNQQKIGNFPIVDLHANLKLKRTRAFFQLMNAATGMLDGNFWAAPDYPLYRRTFRLGIAWTFYD
ncbi:putative porin [Mangrovibacterium diazotrophicum]|uniref:Putative beta-barrel porin n=1 Tax=Mangrovibacterium diazotrophicum TaxID=1261403 RepID=A0A419VVK9_9BACT|nr:putative porin [Mangrovibacterium diazotrophicum]RKD86158.1 putative beta-barrel porin [Mangrovibacterium diazotrophicum]